MARVHVLVRHRVADYPHWKKVFDAALEWRRERGEKSFDVFRQGSDSTDLMILFEWDEIGVARDVFASAELGRRMEESGVVGEPEITFLERVDRGAV